MPTLFSLFSSFALIGTFTIGGGYAMIPLMEKELVDKHLWLTKEDFLDVMALSQAMPGVFAVNMASSVGYRLRGIAGAVAAVIGNILAPIAIIILLAAFFHYFKDNQVVEAVFKGIRPAVVALIAAPVFNMAKSAKVSWQNFWIPIVAALMIWLLGVSPVLIILCAVIGGLSYSYIKRRRTRA